MSKIVGRKSEIERLNRLYNSDRAEFVVVYGRRRVGKTFLIKQLFKDRITFQHTGVSPIDQEDDKSRLKTQLESFYYALLSHGLEGYKQPKSWMEAFFQLQQLLQKLDKGERMVIFIDELPWMDTPRSGFMSAFENFWNGWCNGRDNIMLIVCGSATSWIHGNFLRNKGGLYGRITAEIKLYPFTLKECKEYFENERIELSRYDIVQAYMVFGGIPYYLSYFERGLSFVRNVDKILFGERPKLKDEFDRLFNAIFINANDCKKIVRHLATRHSGYTRDEICAATGIAQGGGLSNTLKALIESDFIISYHPYGESKKQKRYKLVDSLCLFWIKYVDAAQRDSNFMTDNAASDIMNAWKGVAFEEVCWLHIPQIKKALEVAGVKSTTSAWSIKGNDERDGAQIDMIIQRGDNIVNLCEMKFSGTEYSISKDEELNLRRRIESLKESLLKRQTIHLTMITTFGISQGKHSGIVQKSITIDDLFE